MSRIVQIDFRHRQLHFLGEAPRASWTLRLTYPSVTRVSGVFVSATATIDTGSNGFVTISSRGATALGLTQLASRGNVGSERGFDGVTSVRQITLSSLRVGRLPDGSVPARIFVDPTQVEGQPDVNIGNRVLGKIPSRYVKLPRPYVFG